MGEDEHFTNIRPIWQICHPGIFPSHTVTKDIIMDDRFYNQELAFFISPTFVSSQKIFEKTLWFEIYQEIYLSRSLEYLRSVDILLEQAAKENFKKACKEHPFHLNYFDQETRKS